MGTKGTNVPVVVKAKDEEIKVRVTSGIKRSVQRAADARGESESVVVREAINLWLAQHFPEALREVPPNYRTKQ